MYGFYEKDSVTHKREKVKSFGNTFARKGFLIFSQRPLFSPYITKFIKATETNRAFNHV